VLSKKQNKQTGMTTAKPATIDEYIAGFPEETRAILQKIRAVIQAAAPEAKEAIRYAIPTFILNGNLVHFAAFKSHIGFYPAPSGAEAFQNELSVYKTGKGSVQFPLDQPMPLDLIVRIVHHRVAEQAQKSATKTSESKK